MRSTVTNISRALTAIWWTEIHQINVHRFMWFNPTLHALSRRLRKSREMLVHTEDKDEKYRLYKGRHSIGFLSHAWPSMPPPLSLSFGHCTCGRNELSMRPSRHVGTYVGLCRPRWHCQISSSHVLQLLNLFLYFLAFKNSIKSK